MLRLRPLALAAIAVVLGSCGGNPVTTLTLTASPRTLVIGKGNYATLTLTGKFGEDPLLDGGTVDFSVDAPGSFSEEGVSQSEQATIEGHQASVRLYSPSSEAKVVVTATYTDPYSVIVTATVTVTFTLAARVTSLAFACDTKNIGAFLPGYDAKVPCQAVAKDEGNAPVANAKIRFFAEAGEVVQEVDNETGDVAYFYDPGASGGMLPKPKNVDPAGDTNCNDQTGEPCWEDSSMAGTNRTRNPRDGLVTIIAYVEGEPGVQGEPFIDANDDKKWNADEWFKDADGDDEYSEEQEKYIWKQTKILWTGAHRPEAPTGSVVVQSANASYDIPMGGSIDLAFTILDANMNIVAANTAEDNIGWTTEGSIAVSGDPTRLLEIASTGIDMNDKGDITNMASRASYLKGSTYKVTIKNTLTADAEESEPYKFYGKLSRNAGPGSESVSGPGDEETVFAQGMSMKGAGGGGNPP